MCMNQRNQLYRIMAFWEGRSLGILVVSLGVLLGSGCESAPSGASSEEGTQGGSSAYPFAEVTGAAGLGDFMHETGATGDRWFPESMGSGGGFFDYNADGWQDIVLAGGGSWSATADEPVHALKLYRNNKDGTFTDVTSEAGLLNQDAYGIGVTMADYDNDGDTDLFVTTLGENLLYRNDVDASGHHVFAEVGKQAGLANEAHWSSAAMFFDADRDGHVDLYVGNYVDWSPENDLVCLLEGQIRSYCTPELYNGVASRYFRNKGDGTFEDLTEQAGFLPAPGKALGVAEYDINDDGWPDLFVASDTQRDLLYVNNGDGTFVERGALSGMAYDENGKARAGMGIDVGIVDATGEPTLFVGNFSKEMISTYRHAGSGLFLDRSAVSQIGRYSLTTLTFGLFLFDVDLDGDLDLFAANGHVQPEIEGIQEGIGYAEYPHLFINDGNGVFSDVMEETGGMVLEMVARGAAYADYDRDGDLDILVTENGGPAHLFRNDLPRKPSLRIHLEGRASNRDGLSSRVVAYRGGEASERFVKTGSSYLSASELTLTFGWSDVDAGSTTGADSLVVYWPSGTVNRHVSGLEGELLIVEGEATPVRILRNEQPQ